MANHGINTCLVLLLTAVIFTVDGRIGRQRRSGQAITVTTIKEEPFLFVKDPNGSGNDNFEGFIPDLMAKLADKLDLSYNFKLVEDGKYGKETNGRWNGMIGEVIDGDAKLAAGPITVSDERKRVIDFTNPFMSVGTTILIKKPEKGGVTPIKTTSDLADQTEIAYGLVRDGVTQNFFEKSDNPTYRKMWEYMSSHSNDVLVSRSVDGVQKVQNAGGKYAFIIENVTASYWVHKTPCDLMSVGDIDDNRFDRSYAFVIRKNDQLKSQVNGALSELKSNGDLDDLVDKWWKMQSQCDGATCLQLSYLLLGVASLTARHLLL